MTGKKCEEFRFLSADGHTEIFACYWMPQTPPRGILQLSHGMCEYTKRYENFAKFFTDAGYIFCGSDHLGHGFTAPDKEELGFINPGNGAQLLVEDLHTMTVQMRIRFPGLPVFLFGHSMGSFAARCYLSHYGKEVAGAIISGTGNSRSAAGFGKFTASLLIKIRGPHCQSPLIRKLAFGNYNKRFKKEKNAVSWLSADGETREKYLSDPLCNFSFTLAGYETLFTLLYIVSSGNWVKTLPPDLPILLSSGKEDPVGNYGKNVQKLYNRMKKAGLKTELKLYESGRHEIHNDSMQQAVLVDDLQFLNTVLGDSLQNDL